MKKLIFMFLLVVGVCSIVLLINPGPRATGTLQAEYVQQDYVPQELLVKFKEDAVGDLAHNKWQVQNVLNQVQGKINTYLNEEIDTFEWNPTVFRNRSFHADPYLFHIRVPEGIDLEYAIARLKLYPSVEKVERPARHHLLPARRGRSSQTQRGCGLSARRPVSCACRQRRHGAAAGHGSQASRRDAPL